MRPYDSGDVLDKILTKLAYLVMTFGVLYVGAHLILAHLRGLI
jgi:hypothetical protein